MGTSLSHNKYEEIKKIIVNLFIKYNVTCVAVNGFELTTKWALKLYRTPLFLLQRDICF